MKSLFEILLLILLCIPCYVIAASFHELGHVIAGLLSGFRFYLLVVGPIGLKRNSDNKISFYIEKNTALWGGISGTLPQDNNDKNYDAFAKVLLAGPISSIVFSVIFIPIGLSTGYRFFILVGAMALGMGVMCLIPMRSGCFYSDGGRWLRIHRKGQDGLVEMAIWNITQTWVINNNFLGINLKDTEVLKNDKDLRFQYLGCYYNYNYYKENNDFLSAEKEKDLIKELLGKIPNSFAKMYPI